MKAAPVEMSLEAARAAYDKADAAVVAAKAVYEDALAAHRIEAAHRAVDAFYDAVRVLSTAAADVRTAAAKDALEASRVPLPLQCRCEPGTDGGCATPGAPRDGRYALCRKPIPYKYKGSFLAGAFIAGGLQSGTGSPIGLLLDGGHRLLDGSGRTV